MHRLMDSYFFLFAKCTIKEKDRNKICHICLECMLYFAVRNVEKQLKRYQENTTGKFEMENNKEE